MKNERMYLEHSYCPDVPFGDGACGVQVCINLQNYHLPLVDEGNIVIYLRRVMCCGNTGVRQHAKELTHIQAYLVFAKT